MKQVLDSNMERDSLFLEKVWGISSSPGHLTSLFTLTKHGAKLKSVLLPPLCLPHARGEADRD